MPVYILKNNQKYGPYDESTVIAWLQTGQCSPKDFAWRDGMREWQPLRTIFPPNRNDMAKARSSYAPWKCWNCGNELSSEYSFLIACTKCGAGKDGSPPDEGRASQMMFAAVNAARSQIKGDRKRHQRIVAALNNMKAQHDEKIALGDPTDYYYQIIRNRGYKKMVFAWDDLRIINEMARILTIEDSHMIVMQTHNTEGNEQFEVYYRANVSKCFIATAVYGSPNAPEVMIFRRFRDEVLLSREIGRACVNLYYLISPPLASLVANSVYLKRSAKYLFLEPILWLLKAIYRSRY